MSTGRLQGKVAIVTGGGRGIGRAEALLLAREGARVVVNDPAMGQAEAFATTVVSEIVAAGGEAVADLAAIDSMSGAESLIGAAVNAFGRVDIISNNAGIVRPKRIDQMSEEEFDQVIAVNLKGYFAMVRLAAPLFIAQRSGIVINKSSPSGFGHYGMSNYSAAKEGVVGFTRSIARDLGGFGVRANAIRPVSYQSAMATPELVKMSKFSREHLGGVGIWNRPMTAPKGVEPAPQHVAALTVFLCTECAREVNGREFFVSGAEVGIFPEPELQRSMFDPDGWTIEALEEPSARTYLIDEIRNRFPPFPGGVEPQ